MGEAICLRREDKEALRSLFMELGRKRLLSELHRIEPQILPLAVSVSCALLHRAWRVAIDLSQAKHAANLLRRLQVPKMSLCEEIASALHGQPRPPQVGQTHVM